MGLNLNLSLKFHSSLLVRRKLFFCFKLWATTPNNMQQGVKMDTACPSNNFGSCWPNCLALKQQRRWLLKSILKPQSNVCSCGFKLHRVYSNSFNSSNVSEFVFTVSRRSREKTARECTKKA